MGNRNDSERGAALVEMAFVAPLLLLLLFGIIEFSRLLYTHTAVWNVAREGARYATTVGDTDGDDLPNYLDCDGIIDAALARAIGVDIDEYDIDVVLESDGTNADCDPLSPDPDPSTVDIDNGATVTVTADIDFDGIAPFMGFLDNMNIHSEQSRSIFKGVVGS